MSLHFRRSRLWSGVSLLVFVVLGAGLLVLMRAPAPSEPARVAQATELGHVGKVTGPGHVTKAGYAQIREGMTRQQVDSLMGREHRFGAGIDGDLVARAKVASKGGLETTYEEGQGPSRKRAIVTFEMRNFTVTEKELLDEPANPGHVTETNFAQIRKGMSIDEVDSLLGHDHWIMGESSSLRTEITYGEIQGLWQKRAIVTFDAGLTVKDKKFEVVTLSEAEWDRRVVLEVRLVARGEVSLVSAHFFVSFLVLNSNQPEEEPCLPHKKMHATLRRSCARSFVYWEAEAVELRVKSV